MSATQAEDPTRSFLLGPDDWYALHDAAVAAAEDGESLDLHAVDPGSGRFPFAGARSDRLRAVLHFLSAIGPRMRGDARPASLDEDAHAELSAGFRSAARQALDDDVDEDRRLELPDPTAPLWDDDEVAQAVVAALFRLEDADELHAWCARDGLAAAAAAGSPGLRLLIQKAARERPAPAFRALLLEVYAGRDPSGPFAEEAEFAARAGLEWFCRSQPEWLGPASLAPRRAPFDLPAPPDPDEETASSAAPLVTVLIPSYRHGPYVEECIRSVQAQTHRELRILVVDDCSPDDTVERARAVDDDRLEVRCNAKNLGLADSVLGAVETIDTPYVALLNSDDLFHPERIARCLEVLESDPDAQMVATGLHLIDDEGGAIGPDNVSRLRDGPEIFDWVHWYEDAVPEDPGPERLLEELLQHNFLATSSNLVCRTALLRDNRDQIRRLKYCLDWWIFLVAARDRTLRVLPDRLASYRLHSNNTVWFREGRKWSYYLEVNRVATQTLEALVERAEPDTMARVLGLATRSLLPNDEVDGFGLYANRLLGGLELDRAAEDNPEVRRRIEQLHEAARLAVERRHRAERGGDAESGDAGRDRLRTRLLREQLADAEARVRILTADVEGIEAAESSLDQQIEALARGLPEEGRPAVEAPTGRLVPRTWTRVRVLATLVRAWSRRQGEMVRQIDTGQRVLAEVRGERDGLRRQVQGLEALREQSEAVQKELEALRGRLLEQHEARTTALEAALVRAQEETAHVRSELGRSEDARAALRRELDGTRATLRGRDGELAERTDELAKRTRELADAHERIDEADRASASSRRDLAREQERATRLDGELRALRQSVEWKIGYAVWRKIPFFAKTRRFTARAWFRLGEIRIQSMQLLKRLFRRTPADSPPPIRVVAGSTSQFPVISHTFVYQELTAMRSMLGAELTLLHTQDGDREALHEAFTYLDQNREKLTTDWKVHVADLDHFRKTCPERVDRLFGDLSEASGRPRAELEEEYVVRMGFSFARRAQLLGAEYVHSYFFYDQALMALITSYVLDIPRGLSTYADHMMDDWGPLKVVPLHLRNADVVVATSKRIRDELVGIGGDAVAPKVLVKPNGVDGARFPFVERGAPTPDRPLRMICMTRIEPKKGLLELADALALCKQRGVRVEAHVIGSPDHGVPASEEYAERLAARIEEHDLADVLILHGRMRQEQMGPLLESADAFVAPFVETESGDKDGIPTAILEGMSSGLPVVGTTAGSIPEIFDDGIEGYLVEQKDPGALADAIARMATHPEKLPVMGRAARRRFEREFDIRASEPRLHERIRAAVAARRAARAGS